MKEFLRIHLHLVAGVPPYPITLGPAQYIYQNSHIACECCCAFLEPTFYIEDLFWYLEIFGNTPLQDLRFQ